LSFLLLFNGYKYRLFILGQCEAVADKAPPLGQINRGEVIAATFAGYFITM